MGKSDDRLTDRLDLVALKAKRWDRSEVESRVRSEADRNELRLEIQSVYILSLALPPYRVIYNAVLMLSNPNTAISRLGLRCMTGDMGRHIRAMWRYLSGVGSEPEYLTVRFICYLRYAYCGSTPKLSKLTGIPKSTLCYWIKGINHSKSLIVAICQDYILTKGEFRGSNGNIKTKISTNRANRNVIILWLFCNMEYILNYMVGSIMSQSQEKNRRREARGDIESLIDYRHSVNSPYHRYHI